jgi:hypothetical protein
MHESWDIIFYITHGHLIGMWLLLGINNRRDILEKKEKELQTLRLLKTQGFSPGFSAYIVFINQG